MMDFKLVDAINILKPSVEFASYGNVETEDNFNNNIKWVIGATEDNTAIVVDVCPHSEITWTLLKAEMDKL